MTVKHFPNDSALSCKIAKFYIHEFYLNRGFKSAMLSNKCFHMMSTLRLVYAVRAILNTEYRRLWLNWTALERAFDKHELKIILIHVKRIKLKAIRALTLGK